MALFLNFETHDEHTTTLLYITISTIILYILYTNNKDGEYGDL